MSRPLPERDAVWLDRLAEIARANEPPALDATRADAMVRRAIAESGVRPAVRAPAARPARPATGLWFAAAAAVCLAAGLGWALRPNEAPLEATLPSGDRIRATAGASFALLEAGASARRVAVGHGTVLFDVAPLGEDGTFVVEAGDTRVEVRGTVFSVERRDGETRVRVYEGRVEVARGSQHPVVLAAGEMWADDGARALDSGPLAEEGQRAAAARRKLRDASASAKAKGSAASAPGDRDVTPAVAASAADRSSAPDDGAAAEDGTSVDDGPSVASTDEARDARRGQDARGRGRGAPSPNEVRRWIGEGRVDEALDVARIELAARPTDGAWQIVLGDALEASGNLGAAAAAYDSAARLLPRGQAEHAAFSAASIRFRDLGDPSGARRSLDVARAAEPGSALEERALGLRARALLGAGDEAGARRDAARYLEAFPQGSLASWAAAVVSTGAAPTRP